MGALTQKPHSKDHILPPEDVARLRNACQDQQEILLVDIPIQAGLRISELAHLNKTWLAPDDAISIPDRQHCDCGECTRLKGGLWTPKTKHGAREIPIQPALARELREYLAKNESGFGFSRISLWTKIKAIARRAGVKGVFPHALRATCATRFAEQGVSAATLQYVMGWATLESADSYVKSSKRRAQEELGRIWKNPS